MIKLIASDVDGTLLGKREKTVSKALFALIEKLTANGILFAIESGRTYHELYRLFAPVADQVVFASHDGAQVLWKGKALCTFPMDKKEAGAFLNQACASARYDAVLHGRYLSYIKPSSETFESKIRKQFHNHVVPFETVEDIREDVVKLSFYDQNKAIFGGVLLPKYDENHFSAVYEENGWQEFTRAGVNKGTALAFLQETLGIAPEETMAFGDNWNDKEMLARSGENYAMENGKAEVKNWCKHTTAKVEDVLRTLV